MGHERLSSNAGDGMTNIWTQVRENISRNSENLKYVLKDGQYESLIKISDSLVTSGVILADEVGLGKTFIALALMDNIIEARGTVGIVVPPGLMFQWEAEISKFRKLMGKPVLPISKLRGYWDFIGEKHFCSNKTSGVNLIIPEHRPIVLISHTFTTPRIQTNSCVDTMHLPSLYWAALRNKEQPGCGDGKYWRQWLNSIEWDSNGTSGLINHLINRQFKWSPEEEAYFKNKDFKILQWETGQSRKEDIARSFQGNGIGKKILQQLVGQGIGKLDLVIVDEAHKSKGDESFDSVLSNLLGNILNPTKHQEENLRVLGMTATPVELEPAQWSMLLHRIGIGQGDLNSKLRIISSFADNLINSKKHPENRVILEELLVSSKNFETSLKDIVSRRRRSHLASFKSFTRDSRFALSSHPNRKINPISIRFEQLNLDWKKSVLAFEGISKTVKGMKESRILKILDKRYASGLLGKEFADNFSSKKSDEEKTKADIAQEGRIEFWKKLLKDTHDRESSEDHHLNGHPRIQAGADHIESCGDEKILVFGTFTAPLRSLRNVVNFRYMLRQLDKGLPVRVPKEDEGELKDLYQEFLRVKDKNIESLQFTGILKSINHYTDFKLLAEGARKDYDSLSDSLSRFFYAFKEENLPFIEVLPGNEALRRLSDIDSFYNFLKNYILSEILHSKNLYDEYKDSDLIKKEKVTNIAIEVWTAFIKSHGELDDSIELEGEPTADEIGDNMDPKKIMDIIKSDETVINSNRSTFCRFMDGSTKMKSRRTLQLQFNNPNSMPKVLIAQSMVGREGLNLHEACKRVFIFHPEWNPAVVEQQIGRVDRVNSLWERLAKEHYKDNKPKEDFPYIEVDYLIFEGTYDQYQFERMKHRRENLQAQLFGALLPEECLSKVPDDMKERLIEDAPDFSPFKYK
jgi:superfamily II DNA or RNA helicase